MILVTGATGHNGSELVRRLVSRGAAVRAMVHSPHKAASLPDGVDLVEGDYTNPASLAKALDGVDRAFLVTPPVEHAVAWQDNFVRVAKQAGVAHVVKLSMLGADPASPSRFQRHHGEAEKIIEASGMGWTHLRPNFFMQTATQYLQGDAFYAVGGGSRISVVDVHDIAGVAAAVLTESGHASKVYEITGPEALDHSDLAHHLGAALGGKIELVKLSFDQASEVMAGAGFPAWNIAGIIELHEWFQSGAAAIITDTVQSVGRLQPRTFAQFAKDFAQSMQNGN